MHTPIDFVEDIIATQEWPYQRTSSDELIVEISGRWCDYRVHFMWQSEINIMHISCFIDMQIQPENLKVIYELMALINEKLALGHFEITENEIVPSYRYAFLIDTIKSLSTSHMEDILEISISECERFYPAFQFVILGGKTAKEAIEVALLDTIGEA